MPLCSNININLQTAAQNYSTLNSQNGEGYTGGGSGNRLFNAAIKYLDKYLPRGTNRDNGTYYCNALIGCTLQDLGIWKNYSNANGNLNLLRKDSHFIEIKYIGGEKAMVGDIMCIEREGSSGHNMICSAINTEGRIAQVLTAGSSSDPKGKNHVSLKNNWVNIGHKDYNSLHLFRLK